MYMRVDKDVFVEEFKGHDKYNDFTIEGCEAIYDYIVEVEKDSGIPIILEPYTVFELYREFHEYPSLRAAAKEFSDLIDGLEEDPSMLQDYTTIIDVYENGHVIVRRF